nr:PEPxxWA-CTERM sorting domain-containing protein [Polymorphobacter fuscus]
MLMAGIAAPAMAATTTLDFSGSICGPTGTMACGNGSQIGQNYGDGTGIDVSYRSIANATGATAENFLKHWAGSYGDLTNVVWGGSDPTSTRSEIRLTPLAGFEVALLRFDAGCYLNRASCQTLNYDIRSIGGTVIGSGSTPTLHPSHASLTINSGYFSDGIVLQWGPDGYDTGLDNIAFDVRAVGAPGAVPEPASWAMMIGGFGLVGAASRRRRTVLTCSA